ncbi:glutamate--tRNA ligase [Leeuwenhoekiella marinoflava]|uniref:Glutamate--tRNA ligase n=2 Tax=Leeuwenhoekiella marinoflava TaxID=988 RepID=A0A4Q0PR11_9FLAO|nr:glutamate--tRNA ligase [Leeuwenhoekiella marinoflava]RXG32974.1 glutamyl-tRNA synthetase [Leeuwenhoekiella marinoflava]SHE34008.1 glutamyl-tRNA synthetase [Leeuwenhoekiella marinoflava DSM 3653]
MSQNVRVRFAPSPTGPLHIGGVRTALYNYLFAKKHGGTFVLRIEDTDQNRYVEGAENYIIEALNWCGIPFEEGPGKEGGFGPYRQSERKDKYFAFAEKLIVSGDAYYAFDTAEALDAHRKEHEENGKTFIYNWHNRNKLDNSLTISAEETQLRIEAGEDYVIRFKSPDSEILELEDIIRGSVEVDTSLLDDKVLFKADGMPTYHLANIVDDHLMEISHVIRGEEWLPSLALHVMLYRAFGWEAPQFAHLPLIMKPVGKGKLSKRDGDKMGFPVFPLEWKDPKTGDKASGYREDGYLPESMVNMLAFLGWNPGTEKEIYTLEELVKDFDLERVHKSGAKFDPEKTKWFQQQHLHLATDESLVSGLQAILAEKQINCDDAYVQHVIHLVKDRAIFIADLWEQGSFFFERPTSYDEKAAKKAWKEDTGNIMTLLTKIIAETEDFTAENLSANVKDWIQSEGLSFGKVMQPLRLSLVGSMSGPDVFEIASTIGQEKTLERIRFAIETL